jgi:transmembrane sensor
MLTKQALKSIIDQYVTGTLDASGKENLHRIIADPAYEELVGELMDEAFEERMAGSYQYPETQQRIKQQLLQQIRSSERPVRQLNSWRKWWAAAAILVGVAGAGTYFWWQRPAPQTTIATVTPDVLPGSNKAVLVLADGSLIALDSTGTQVIQQGQTAIHQQKGQLQYVAQGSGMIAGFNTLRTPRGGQYQITLPDGTKAWLNSASSLKYPTAFTGRERVVELNGQGYFEIAANAAKPFKVKVNGALEVQVLGTHFDIMAYADEGSIKTTLLQGAVRVKQGASTEVLQPGQQAIADPSQQHIAVKETDVNKVIAWKNGLFIFNNMELGAILREVSRWYDVEIVYQAPPNKNLYGGGISRTQSLAGVLRFLEAGGTNHFKIEDKKVIVLP